LEKITTHGISRKDGCYFKPVSLASERQKATDISSQKNQPRGKYTIYSKEDRAAIGKYASDNGKERARVKFIRKYPNLSESRVGNFKRMYLSLVRE